jgi:hypothetical protein
MLVVYKNMYTYVIIIMSVYLSGFIHAVDFHTPLFKITVPEAVNLQCPTISSVILS